MIILLLIIITNVLAHVLMMKLINLFKKMNVQSNVKTIMPNSKLIKYVTIHVTLYYKINKMKIQNTVLKIMNANN